MQGSTFDAMHRASRATALPLSAQSVALACANLLNIDPVRVEYPGGASRCAVRVVAEKCSYIVTPRRRIAAAITYVRL